MTVNSSFPTCKAHPGTPNLTVPLGNPPSLETLNECVLFFVFFVFFFLIIYYFLFYFIFYFLSGLIFPLEEAMRLCCPWKSVLATARFTGFTSAKKYSNTAEMPKITRTPQRFFFSRYLWEVVLHQVLAPQLGISLCDPQQPTTAVAQFRGLQLIHLRNTGENCKNKDDVFFGVTTWQIFQTEICTHKQTLSPRYPCFSTILSLLSVLFPCSKETILGQLQMLLFCLRTNRDTALWLLADKGSCWLTGAPFSIRNCPTRSQSASYLSSERSAIINQFIAKRQSSKKL